MAIVCPLCPTDACCHFKPASPDLFIKNSHEVGKMTVARFAHLNHLVDQICCLSDAVAALTAGSVQSIIYCDETLPEVLGVVTIPPIAVDGVTITGTGCVGDPLTAGGGGGLSVSAQYSQIGSQPGTLAATQPFTFTTANITDPSITAVTSVGGGTQAGSGTHFTFSTAGRYEISYQTTPLSGGPGDAGIVIYQGTTLANGLPVPYTMLGTFLGTSMSNSILIDVLVGDVISLNAAAGNAAAVQFGPNSSTTNAAATTISFMKIA